VTATTNGVESDPAGDAPATAAASDGKQHKARHSNPNRPEPPQTLWDHFWQAVSSGLFFMIVGTGFLAVANYTMGSAHSSFSFVLVVVGVAILLYGTGTQGIGQFHSHVGAATYRVALAGGAGVLAFCVGIGIVWKANDIKDAFQIEKKYLRVVIQPDVSDGVSQTIFSNYVANISFDGESVPVARRGNTVEALVYYYLNRTRSGTLSVDFYFMGPPESRSSIEVDHASKTFPLVLSDQVRGDSNGGLDFPAYTGSSGSLLISLQATETKKLETADNNQRSRPASGQPVVPPLFPTEQ